MIDNSPRGQHVHSVRESKQDSFVINWFSLQDVNVDVSAEFVDIIGINKYFAWYGDTGHLELITRQMTNELQG